MDIEKEENGNLVFHNENESFTFVDMGSYVGHQNRQWYEQSPSCWRLMFYDNNEVHIDALVDSIGDYSKIVINSGNIKRVLLLNRNHIDEDSIYEMDSEDSILPKKTYIAFEDKYIEKAHPDLQTYLSMEQQFLSKTGEVYTGDSFNNYINRFFNYNTELSDIIENQDSIRQR